MTWPTKKLGEVLDYEQPGKYIVSSKNYSSEYKTPVLTAGKTFILGNTDEKENIFPAKKLPVIIFDDFTTAIKLVDFPFKVKSSAMKILHAKKDIADVKYVFYAMQTVGLNHATHKRYWISEYSKLEIPLPPLSEQKKIVAKLESVLGKISKAKKLRAEAQKNADNLLSAEFHKIFSQRHSNILQNVGMSSAGQNGWQEKELREIVEQKTVRNTKQNLPFVGMEDVESETGKFLGSLKPRAVRSTTFYFNKESVLYGKLRPYLNKVLLPNFEGHCSTEFIPLKPRKEVAREWIAYWLKSPQVVGGAMSTNTGSRMPRANMKDLMKFKIPLPPLAEQKKIVARLDSLSQKIGKIKNLQSATQNDFIALEQAVLSKAFSGK